MNNYRQQHNEFNQLFNALKHRRLKYIALTVICAVIAAQISMIIWIDDIPNHIKVFIQGCIGIGAIVFVLLVTIIAYRVFTEYFRSKYDRSNK
jgi:nitrogen fixation/metabolism regulation signal transduction histidine kinase